MGLGLHTWGRPWKGDLIRAYCLAFALVIRVPGFLELSLLA